MSKLEAGRWKIWIDDLDGELAMDKNHMAKSEIEVLEAQPALSRIAELEAENDYLKIANQRSVDAAYHALLHMSAWLGIPENKRKKFIDEEMENVKFCADVKNQKPLLDQSFQQLQTQIKLAEAKLSKASDALISISEYWNGGTESANDAIIYSQGLAFDTVSELTAITAETLSSIGAKNE